MENNEGLNNGNDPLDLEAKLAAQVDTIGTNPTEDPGVDGPADAGSAAGGDGDAAAAGGAAAAAPAAGAGDAAAAAAGDDTAAAAAAASAASASAAATAAAPAPAAAAPPPLVAPTPPRDFDAAHTEAQRRYDDGEIDGDEYQKEIRAIAREEGAFSAELAIYKDKVRTADELAGREWNGIAVAWEKTHATFLANPIRAREMQATLDALVKANPSAPAAAIFKQAETIVFDAFNYKPDPATVVDPAAAIADATAKRTPAGVPPTLASAAQAAPIEAASHNAAYASLDTKDISSLEDAIARMTPDQLNAYLADAPGAKSVGVAS
ncbi:hypothetical protein [Dyella japonica]|uniref:Uncharacterized protein n=1 Tax=Dyella japonica DSM 16301 TaxID=1440762 RepID=A0A0G9H7H0_9GAMM|nr:hypothetical protein [Dyella japonica]KLD65431.1 hypothetical protein Y882_02605 [Dyella japonica DSM 16301]